MKFLHSDKAPAAIGPYSQATSANKTIYVSGQLPIVDGELQTDIKKATKADLKLKIIGATLASTAFPLLVNSKAPNFLDLPVTFVVSLLTYLLFIKIEKK
ncbi:MAG: Rid family hydrolase, partial [Finegoldia magna]|nr:Rid family hydrolase [Finegoldia magna]